MRWKSSVLWITPVSLISSMSSIPRTISSLFWSWRRVASSLIRSLRRAHWTRLPPRFTSSRWDSPRKFNSINQTCILQIASAIEYLHSKVRIFIFSSELFFGPIWTYFIQQMILRFNQLDILANLSPRPQAGKHFALLCGRQKPTGQDHWHGSQQVAGRSDKAEDLLWVSLAQL